MKNIAIIFTRHALTQAQAVSRVEYFDEVIDWSERASQTLTSSADAEAILDELLSLAAREEVKELTVFGVIPPVLRSALFHTNDERSGANNLIDITIYEAHNINRAADGIKPQFEFAGWLMTGSYEI